MVVLRDPGEVYLLRHTGGPDGDRLGRADRPDTLEVVARSPDLPGGPTWPGGIAAHANGSLYVVFGNHAHRLGARPRGARVARAPARPSVQQLRDPARRPPRHEGLRRRAPRRRSAHARDRAGRAARARARTRSRSSRGCDVARARRSRACRPTATTVYVVGDEHAVPRRAGTARALALDDDFRARTARSTARPTAGTR